MMKVSLQVFMKQ